MRVLTLNTSNSAGGATKACLRLHQSLIDSGMEADLLMLEQPQNVARGHNFYEFYTQQAIAKRNKTSLVEKIRKKILYELGRAEEAVTNKRNAYEARLINQKKHGSETMHFAQSRYRIQEHPLYKQADIVHLHCMINNFLDYPSFFANTDKPIVWTLHDMTPFTGGCVYSEGCEGFVNDCSNCPQLQGTENPEYAAYTLQVKRQALFNFKRMVIVSPSLWLLNLSKRSTLFNGFRHEHIPYGIDSEVFQPRDKAYSRALLGLPPDKPVLLFVAQYVQNSRKGYSYLLEAIKTLNLYESITLCAVGNKTTSNTSDKIFEIGSVSDERLMSIVYSAADVFIIPSLHDNLPNTVLESLLCGTPVIGFPVGGINDMIKNGVNGYLCEDVSVDALTAATSKFLQNKMSFNTNNIREDAVKKYHNSAQLWSYRNLYKELIGNV
jgi:glycosyltransferase involved in cell wall biosynthesis